MAEVLDNRLYKEADLRKLFRVRVGGWRVEGHGRGRWGICMPEPYERVPGE
mgnify:CR=1 FL=1